MALPNQKCLIKGFSSHLFEIIENPFCGKHFSKVAKWIDALRALRSFAAANEATQNEQSKNHSEKTT